jgi:hypothetical protein
MLELGAELGLLTCDDCPMLEQGADVSDIALFRALARHSVGERVELTAGTSLLAKQPKAWDESVWQGVFVGARVPFARHFAANTQAAAGPLLGPSGSYWQAGVGFVARAEIEYFVRFELGVEELFTRLAYDDAQTGTGTPSSSWLEEVAIQVQAQFGGRGGGGWLGGVYALPLAHSSSAAPVGPSVARELDPEPRLDLQAGGVIKVDGWDLYAIYSLVDRGELARPETTLPILEGGFDQRELTFGLRYRFDASHPR